MTTNTRGRRVRQLSIETRLEKAAEKLKGRTFVLGLDLDNVCADYSEAFRAYVAKAKGVDIETLEPVTAWDFTDLNWGISDRAEYEMLHGQAIRHGMFRTMPMISGASEVLWKLSDIGVHIRVITHRLFIKGLHETSASDTIAWLDINKIPYRDLCMVADKPAVGADVYLDDGPRNIIALRAAAEASGDGSMAVVFDQPYNRDLDGPRVEGWNEALELILERIEAL